jgi:hypothetical protein
MAVLLFLTFAAWSMGSAVGSSPDEGYVLTSIWCANTPALKGLDDPARKTDQAQFGFLGELLNPTLAIGNLGQLAQNVRKA